MSKEYPCIYHQQDGLCSKYSADGIISYCVQGPCPHETPSRADRIRAMSDEELAELLNRIAEGESAPRYCRNLPERDENLETDKLIPLERCLGCLLHWLQQPADPPGRMEGDREPV